MTCEGFSVWRILEEAETKDEHGTIRVVTKKQLVGEIGKPKEEIYVTWMELVERFGEGYYLVEIPKEICRRYVVPDRQFVRTPAYFERSEFQRFKDKVLQGSNPETEERKNLQKANDESSP